MLRITPIQPDPLTRVLKLEGKLLEPWIEELQEVCRHAQRQTAVVVLDLAAVSFVDASGAIALRHLIRQGVAVQHCSPLVVELLKENCP
jgi:anti-anti-sigma regulatory factor